MLWSSKRRPAEISAANVRLSSYSGLIPTADAPGAVVRIAGMTYKVPARVIPGVANPTIDTPLQ
jgi:hypothetical protein